MKKVIIGVIAAVAVLASATVSAADTNPSISDILGGTKTTSTGSSSTGTSSISNILGGSGSTGSTQSPGAIPATSPQTAPNTGLDSLLGNPTGSTAEKPTVSVQTRTATGDTVAIGKWNKDFRIELTGNGTFKRSDFTVVSVNSAGIEQPVTDFSVSDVRNELSDGTAITGRKVYLGLLQTADSVKISISGQSRMDRIIRFINKDNGQIEEVYKFDFSPAASAPTEEAVTATGVTVTQPGGDVKNTGVADHPVLLFLLGIVSLGGYVYANRRKTA